MTTVYDLANPVRTTPASAHSAPACVVLGCALALSLLGLLNTLAPARAQDQVPDVSGSDVSENPATVDDEASRRAVEQRIETLESRQEVLESQLESRSGALAAPQAASTATPTASDVPTVTAKPGKGFTITTADKLFSATVKPRVQIRNTFTRDKVGDTNDVQIKTLRLYFQGHALDPDLKYNVQFAFGAGDFENGNASPIFDAWVEYTKFRDLNLRFGQYFVPFDRARTVREYALQLVDRPQVVRELTLDRDAGLMIYSQDLGGLDGILAYHLFVGGGKGRNRVGGEPVGPLVVGRFAVRPFGAFDDDHEADIERLHKLRVAWGVTGGYNHHTTRQNSTYGSTFTLGKANYAHAATDLVVKYAGFSLLAEGVLRHAMRDEFAAPAGSETASEYTRSGYGYLVQGGYMLTRLVEIAARWDELFAEDGTDPKFVQLADTRGRELGGGVNLYLNGHFFKLQADYALLFGRTGSDERHIARVQLDATF